MVAVVVSGVSTDSSCEVHILFHDSDTLGVDGAQVGVLKNANKVCFGGFLQGFESMGLESEAGVDT